MPGAIREGVIGEGGIGRTQVGRQHEQRPSVVAEGEVNEQVCRFLAGLGVTRDGRGCVKLIVLAIEKFRI